MGPWTLRVILTFFIGDSSQPHLDEVRHQEIWPQQVNLTAALRVNGLGLLGLLGSCGFRVLGLGSTWTPEVCKIIAFMAVIYGFRDFILLGFR